MPKKCYCQNCQNLIEEGRGVKVHKGANYYSSRYSSYPRDYYVYYLCPKCFSSQQEEIKAKKEKVWKQVGLTLLIITLVLIVGAIFFLVYQHQRDKKLDKITKKSQKNNFHNRVKR